LLDGTASEAVLGVRLGGLLWSGFRDGVFRYGVVAVRHCDGIVRYLDDVIA
jgi:hypothetical protein